MPLLAGIRATPQSISITMMVLTFSLIMASPDSIMSKDVEQQFRDALTQLDALFRKTETPDHRLFLVAAYISVMYALVADAFKAGKLGSEHVADVSELLGRSRPLLDDPPGNFVDMVTSFYNFLEQSKGPAQLDDIQRPLLEQVQKLLYTMTFTPPESLRREGDHIAIDLRDFAAFVKEFRAETDRGAALVGAALIDSRLEQLLHRHFLNEDIADKLLSNSSDSPLSRFSARIDLCYALGLITKIEYEECVIIRRVRNRFAHKLHGLTFETQQIADWCSNLKSMPYARWGAARQRFVNSVITLCMVLWHRPSHAVQFRAQEREWAWHLAYGTTKAQTDS